MICEHRLNGNCLLASAFVASTGIPSLVTCKDDAFKACSECACPFTVNYVVASLSITTLKKVGVKESPVYGTLLGIVRKGKRCVLGGVGTEMHLVIKKAGYDVKPGCPCIPLMKKMDENGPEWCLGEGYQEILIGVSESFADRHPTLSKVVPKVIIDARVRHWLTEAIRRWDEKLKETVGK